MSELSTARRGSPIAARRRPGLAFLAWVGLAICVIVMFFGQLLNFPLWLIDVSSFRHQTSSDLEHSFDSA